MTDLFDDDDFDIPDADDDEALDIDSLRASSARASSMFDEDMEEMDMDIMLNEGSSGFSLSSFTSGQRLILAVLLLFDIIAIGVGILVVTGRF
jgi:hypothetical protein